jgi:hypothetical protein
MQPSKMIEAQQDLSARLDHNQKFIELALRMIAHTLDARGVDAVARDPDKAKTLATLMSLMHMSAKGARCYHVSPDMTALIQHAAAGLDDTDVVDFKALAPFPYGLVRFDGEGLKVTDPRGDVMNMDWILWGDCAFVDDRETPDQIRRDDPRAVREGFVVWEFNDRIENPDSITLRNQNLARAGVAALNKAMGRWEIMGSQVCESGTRLGPSLIEPEGLQRANLIAEGVDPQAGTNTLRFLHAFWLLLQQPITETQVARLTGPARKAVKAKGLKATGEVSLVQLRRSVRQARAEAAVDPKRHVEWAGRWYVNGGWRWQAYGPKHSLRKRIWVDGFIKGPADKPLIVRKHVYTVRP